MNKLQLYIYKSLAGFKAVRNINPSENVQRHIRDVRRALEVLDYDPAEKYLFYLVSYIPEGTFFTVLRTIPPRAFDHLATTIFVPRGVQIDVDEMSEIVKRTTRMVSNPAVTADDLAELHAVFSTEYPCDAEAPDTIGSWGTDYAVCRYGGETGRVLEDFFGHNLYQTDYLPYAGVLLVDDELGVTTAADDLTDLMPGVNVSLLPPAQSSDGFTPYVLRHAVTRPMLVPLGRDITVTWRRPGFEDRLQEITVEADGQRLEAVDTIEARKMISPASFYITSHTAKTPVANAVVSVNGVDIEEPQSFTLGELRQASVEVRAPGYAPFRTTCDLASATQTLIQLPDVRKVFRFELPVRTSELGAPIRFAIHTKRDITASPIEGYELSAPVAEGASRINHLHYVVQASVTRTVLLSVAAALVAGFLLGWVVRGGGSGDGAPAADSVAVEETVTPANASTPVKKQAATTTPAPTPAKAVSPTKAAAIKYLEEHKAWKRDELEQYPDLHGLFDDLNSFNYARITGHWKKELKSSANFAKVVNAVEEGQRKKVFVPDGSRKYCRPDDRSISYINYCYRVDPRK